mgnify:CR=1 FL=1
MRFAYSQTGLLTDNCAQSMWISYLEAIALGNEELLTLGREEHLLRILRD